MGRVLVAVAVIGVGLVLGFAPNASAVTLVLPDGTEHPQPWQSWVDASQVPTPPVRVQLVLESCPYSSPPGSPACAMPGDGYYCREAACIWLNPVEVAPGGAIRPALLHELGHVFDYTVMSDAHRAGFLKIMRDRRPWRSDSKSPHEQFAVAYDLCARGGNRTWRRWRSMTANGAQFGYGYRATPPQHRRVCALIRRAAGA